MPRHWIFGWVVLVSVGSAAPAQTPYSRNLLPTRTALARVGLERNWMAAIPLVGAERVSEISIAGGLLFAQTNHANFFALDAETGRLLWSASLGRRTGDVFPASANSHEVFVTNGSYLFALDRRTGREVWRENLRDQPSSPTACDEDLVMVGLETGRLVAYDTRVYDKEGVLVKDQEGRTSLANRPRFVWNWQTSGPMTARPLPAGKVVAFGGHDGRLYVALMEVQPLSPPTMLYRIPTGGEIFASMGAHDTRTLLVPSADKNVYSIDLFTAKVNWAFASGAPVLQQPFVAGDDVYVANKAGVLTAVDVHSGSPRWSISTHGGRLVSVSGTRIYLETHDEDLFIVDRATGRVVADPRSTFVRAGVNLRDYTLGVTNDLNDRIYLGTKSGLVLSLREIGQLQPLPLRDPKAKPFGYIPPEGLQDAQTPPSAPPAEQPATDEATPKDEATPPAGEPEAPKEDEAPK